jgi:hypothetical protein
MSTHTNLSRITIDIPKIHHKKLKALAAILGKSMKEIVIESIEAHIQSTDIPNKQTLKAIKNVEAGKNLVAAKNLDDLFKKLGI